PRSAGSAWTPGLRPSTLRSRDPLSPHLTVGALLLWGRPVRQLRPVSGFGRGRAHEPALVDPGGLCGLLGVVPVLGWIAAVVMWFTIYQDLARSFGKSPAFAILLTFLPWFGWAYLAFSSAQYQ